MVRVGCPTVSPVGRPTCTARCPPPSLLPPGSDRVGPWSGTSGGPGAQKKHVGFVVFSLHLQRKLPNRPWFLLLPSGKDGNSISPPSIVNGFPTKPWMISHRIRTPRWCRCPPPRPHLGKLLPSHRPLERGRNPPRPWQHSWMVGCYSCVIC